MMKTDLVEQKSMLAKLMAAENISVEHKKIPTAAFDIKNRVLYLPILKWKPGSNVYDLFCAHEVGHALWTPEEGWHSSISKKGKGYKSFLNVIEDARIEKKIKRKFAGARKCMAGGYNELMDEDFFGLRKMGVIPNDLGLIDRINLYTKAGSDYGVEFSDEEREWVEKVERTETWEDVVEVTDALYEWCKENESETDNSYDEFDDDSEWNDDHDSNDYEDSEEDDSENDSEENGASGSESEEDDSEEDDSKKNGASGSEGEESEEADNTERSSNNFEGGKSDPYGDREFFAHEEENDPTSLTDEAFRDKEEELADMSENVIVPTYLSFPKINTESVVIDHKVIQEELSKYYNSQDGAVEYGNKLLREFKTANGKMISYMVKEFEMKKAADIHRRAYASKKGNLDMNKIHAYKYSENLFRQITNLPEGKNHGMVMFIDWSGSMHGYMKDTIEQLINLTMFCQKVQIPFEVYAFSDHYRDYGDSNAHRRYYSYSDENKNSTLDTTRAGKKVADYKKHELIVSTNLRLMTLFSSKMRNRELNEAYKNVLMIAHSFSNYYAYRHYNEPYFGMPANFSLGGTPLDSTIVCAKSVIEEFKTKTKAQIVNAVFLTDGQSNRDNHYLDSDNVRRRVERQNLHIDDPVTRTRTYSKRENGRQMDTTSIFLSALKNSLGINLLGFFLTSGTGRRTAGDMSYIMERYPLDSEVAKFRKEKFLIETKTSYDELYIINTKGLEIDEVDHMDKVEVGATKAMIRRALKKNTSGKLQNRLLLNAFIKKVA